MMVFDEKADQVLFLRVMAFVIMTAIVFIESVLGLVPAFYGSVPKISFCMLFLIGLNKPEALPVYNIAFIGLIYDVLQANPFGYTSSIFLIVLGVVTWRRPFLITVDASVIWSEFVIMLSGLMIFMLVIFGLYHGAWPPFAEILFQIGFTALLFPIFNWGYSFTRQLGLYLGGER